MDSVNQIKVLLDQGDYLKAASLADQYNLTDCREINDLLDGMIEVGNMIDQSISHVSSLEEKLSGYERDLTSLQDKAVKIEAREHAVEIQGKNISNVCNLIELLVKNLRIPEDVEKTLNDSLNGESSAEETELALSQLDTIIKFEADPNLNQMRCVQVQKERALEIKNRYCNEKRRMKNNLDLFMEQQLESIRTTEAPKQPKCGILDPIQNFGPLVKQTESIFKYTGSRADIDNWYEILVRELFEMIDRVEHSKTPPEMIRLENYYFIHDVLRSLKIPCLESQRKEANNQYKTALNSYVSQYFGRPLEKVNVFFEGVQAKIAQGVKEEEISFQLAFSKQELRKVLQMVTLKEVRKGLEDMYRRIEKHAFEPDSNLIQVIWRAMQEEFLSQHKAILGMIERCYPSSNLSLTFTIDDLCQVFSDIAQTH